MANEVKNSGNTIHIALAFDQNFLTPFYVLLTSVFENNKQSNFYIHAIATGIDGAEKKRIINYVEANNSKILFYELQKKHLETVVMPVTDPRYTLANFYRLFFPILISDTINKVIYLDTDIVVIGDLATLYNTNVEAVPFAAVLDPAKEIRVDLGIREPNSYFNSGVLLMNLDNWREQKISEKALQFVSQYPEKCIYVDQCALNAVSINNWIRLDSRFNVMGQYVPVIKKKYYKDFLKDKVIIHFNIRKPWDRLCQMRLKYLYYYYYHKSPQASSGRLYNNFNYSIKNIGRLIRNKVLEFYHDHFSVSNPIAK